MNKDLELLRYSLDPIVFIREILGLKCEWFHKEWVELFENYKYVSLLAPRGHGKSHIVAAYIIWRIVRDPNIRVLTITINQDKANEMMMLVKSQLESNERLTELFGPQRSFTDWSSSTFRVQRAGKTGIAHKEPTFTVLGVTASMVGGHYDIIILDDITDQNNSRTPGRRKTLENLYNMTVTPMLEPEGQIISIGTKWHEHDIHWYLASLKNYKTKIYKAIDIESGKPTPLWQDQWPLEKLEERKVGMGNTSFEMQYQNNIISTEDSPIKREWIEQSLEEFKPPMNEVFTYIGVDLASKGEESDYFTITVIGIDQGKIYVLDGIKTKASLFRQFELIKSYDAKWKPMKIGIEQAAQQKIIVDQLQESSLLPIVPIKSSIVNDRMSRVQRLSVLFETGRIYLNPKLSEWADELLSFPRGANDDTIDSLSFAIQASQADLEEDTKIDWNIVPSMIVSKSVDMSRKKSSDTYRVTKI